MNTDTITKKSLKFFMREEAKTEEIISVPGPDTIKDDKGNSIMLEIKVLSNATIQKINDAYKTRSLATDKKGNPIVVNGEVVFRTERDASRASQHMIAEALVYPDLKDKELMAFFDCHDVTEMPFKVFPRADEYAHVSRVVLAALGLGGGSLEDDKSNNDKIISEVKN